MEKQIQNQDIDSDNESFEICEPVINSMSDSMSIVAIPEPIPRTLLNSSSVAVQPSDSCVVANSSTDDINNCQTRCVDSFDGLPNYNEIQEQEYLTQKMSNNATEEQNNSLQKLSDNLLRIEDNVKNGSNNISDILAANLDTYLKELRDENEELKTKLEKNNLFMKQQLKNLHEWQTKNEETIEDHKRALNYSKQLSDENQCLKEENQKLMEKVAELEVKAILADGLTTEVDSLRSRCQQMANYEKLDVTSELQIQELASRLVKSQQTVDGLNTQINGLRKELSDAQTQLEAVPVIEMQLKVYKHDFEIEEMAKVKALNEVSQLEEELEKLKVRNSELEDKLDRGEPVVNLQKEELPVGKHHRRHRHSGRLSRNPIPALNVGAVLKGFKQYKPTSKDV